MEDADLLKQLKEICCRYNYSPVAALTFLEDTLTYRDTLHDRATGPHPVTTESFVLDGANWAWLPLFLKLLIPEKSTLEYSTYASGRTVVRLIDPQRLRLMAREVKEAGSSC